jgi:hypothetical protein
MRAVGETMPEAEPVEFVEDGAGDRMGVDWGCEMEGERRGTAGGTMPEECTEGVNEGRAWSGGGWRAGDIMGVAEAPCSGDGG